MVLHIMIYYSYNVATEIYKPGRTDFPALIPQNGAMAELLLSRLPSEVEPDIISASRSTDIPAFYADWFFHRLETGYSVWNNPFNGKKSYISYRNTRFIVFWSKNPKPLLPYLPILKERGIGCYIQFTLNDYEEDGLETGVPPLTERIETFRTLSDI